MQYKIIVGKNNELYYKVYKNNTVKKISKEQFDKHFAKHNQSSKNNQKGGNGDNTVKLMKYLDNAVRYNKYKNTVRYLAVGMDKDGQNKVILGIEPIFSQAKERVDDWCLKICKYQVFDKKQRKLGTRLIRQLDGVNSFIDSSVCHHYNNGIFGIEPDSRKGEVYQVNYNPENKEYIRGSVMYSYPGDYSL